MSRSGGLARIVGTGVALPPHQLDQAGALTLALARSPGTEPRVLTAIYARSGVQSRGSVLFGPDQWQGFYRDGATPTTRQRMARYEAEAIRLALPACHEALDAARVPASRVSHLVTASCTGCAAPGFDLQLVPALGLSGEVRRTHLGFMGCHAAINALRVAKAFAEADPAACVLVCCAELSSLHYQTTDRSDHAVSNAIFADGAAAVVVAADGPAGAPVLASTRSAIIPDTAELMGWHIGDHGFEMTLSPRVPEAITSMASGWVDGWLADERLARAEIGGWAIHPGGPRLLRAVAGALGIDEPAIRPSREVLERHGNMSSPTVLMIVRELMRAGVRRPWIVLAFGPGLTAEGLLVR